MANDPLYSKIAICWQIQIFCDMNDQIKSYLLDVVVSSQWSLTCIKNKFNSQLKDDLAIIENGLDHRSFSQTLPRQTLSCMSLLL